MTAKLLLLGISAPEKPTNNEVVNIAISFVMANPCSLLYLPPSKRQTPYSRRTVNNRI